MSVKWITWAWEQPLPPGPKFVLVALADHAGEDGVCWPGTARLGEKTGIANSTIREHLNRLEKIGCLTRTRRRRGDGTLGTYEYTLQAPAPGSSAGDHRQIPAEPPPDSGATTAEIWRAEPSSEPSVEPSPLLPARSERSRNELWDALEVELGPATTPTECSLRGKAVKELKAADASPDDIHARCVEYRRRWPNVSLTQTALLKHWSALAEQSTAPAPKMNPGTQALVNARNARLAQEGLPR